MPLSSTIRIFLPRRRWLRDKFLRSLFRVLLCLTFIPRCSDAASMLSLRGSVMIAELSTSEVTLLELTRMNSFGGKARSTFRMLSKKCDEMLESIDKTSCSIKTKLITAFPLFMVDKPCFKSETVST
jgi:hypothetical protein